MKKERIIIGCSSIAAVCFGIVRYDTRREALQAVTEDIQASLNAGMNAHLAKPLNIDELLKTIARFVR